MFFIKRIQLSFHEASPVLVHVFLVISVVVYIVFGALMMQYFEAPDEYNHKNPVLPTERAVSYEMEAMETLATWGTISIDRDYSGADLTSEDPNIHICIQRVMADLMGRTKCSEQEVDLYILNPIDECYQNAVFELDQKVKQQKTTKQYGKKGKLHKVDTDEIEIIHDEWTFTNSIIFAFTVITTIGYGHIAPVTIEGRLFCIIYGLIGVPFTLLTIADIGMFLSRLLRLTARGIAFVFNAAAMIRREGMLSVVVRRKVSRLWMTEVPVESPTKQVPDNSSEEEEDGRPNSESIGLFLTFVIYLLLGAYLLSLYEPEMDYFKAFYFNFVTLTTIGLGDFVPRSDNYLLLTLIYITIGLALTTLAIEIAADYLKKLHYFGRKIEGVAKAEVWFGGKKMRLKNLIRHLGDQLNIPVDQLETFNIDHFVDNAIKVEDGEMETLRKPSPLNIREIKPLSYRDIRKPGEPSTIGFADERTSMTTYRSDGVPLATAETSRTLPTLREDSIQERPKADRYSQRDTMTFGSEDETSIEEDLIREVSMEPMPTFPEYA